MPQKEVQLRKCLPNRKTDTQTGNQEPKRKTCPRKKPHWKNIFPTGRLTPKREIKNPKGRLAPERSLIKKTPSQQEVWHPNRKSRTPKEDLPQKEVSLRKCLPNRKTDTQTGNQESKRKTCPRKKSHWENASHQEDWHPNRKSRTQKEDLPQKEASLRKCFPNRKTDTQTGNQEPKRKTCPRKKSREENAFPTGRLTLKQVIKNPKARLAPERSLIKKMPSQQEDGHPNRKSRTQKEDLPQREVSLRKCLPNRKADNQTGNREPKRKTCPRKKSLPNRKTDTQTGNQEPKRKTCPRKKSH